MIKKMPQKELHEFQAPRPPKNFTDTDNHMFSLSFDMSAPCLITPPSWNQNGLTMNLKSRTWSQNGPKTPNLEPRPYYLEPTWPQDERKIPQVGAMIPQPEARWP